MRKSLKKEASPEDAHDLNSIVFAEVILVGKTRARRRVVEQKDKFIVAIVVNNVSGDTLYVIGL
eukprot:10351395-Ditylum_brightwellii.AAC.1